jgi:hypothetical protein
VAAEPGEERVVVRRPGTETFSKGPLSPCAQSPLPAILSVGPRMERLITMCLTKILRTLPRLWSNSTLPLNPCWFAGLSLQSSECRGTSRVQKHGQVTRGREPGRAARSNYRGAFDVGRARSRWRRCSLRVSVALVASSRGSHLPRRRCRLFGKFAAQKSSLRNNVSPFCSPISWPDGSA